MLYRRFVSLVVAIVALTASWVPPAHAALWTGTCTVLVTVNFGTRITAAGISGTNYSISLEGVDLNPVTAGQQACAITLDPLEPTRSTGGGGNGSSSLWTCGFGLGSGSWSQSWADSSGVGSPPTVVGSHTITGSWNDWVLEVNNPALNFVGVAELTLQAAENLKLAQCAGAGVSSITMIGQMIFQDP
jgi:hypothetical protein